MTVGCRWAASFAASCAAFSTTLSVAMCSRVGTPTLCISRTPRRRRLAALHCLHSARAHELRRCARGRRAHAAPSDRVAARAVFRAPALRWRLGPWPLLRRRSRGAARSVRGRGGGRRALHNAVLHDCGRLIGPRARACASLRRVEYLGRGATPQRLVRRGSSDRHRAVLGAVDVVPAIAAYIDSRSDASMPPALQRRRRPWGPERAVPTRRSSIDLVLDRFVTVKRRVVAVRTLHGSRPDGGLWTTAAVLRTTPTAARGFALLEKRRSDRWVHELATLEYAENALDGFLEDGGGLSGALCHMRIATRTDRRRLDVLARASVHRPRCAALRGRCRARHLGQPLAPCADGRLRWRFSFGWSGASSRGGPTAFTAGGAPCDDGRAHGVATRSRSSSSSAAATTPHWRGAGRRSRGLILTRRTRRAPRRSSRRPWISARASSPRRFCDGLPQAPTDGSGVTTTRRTATSTRATPASLPTQSRRLGGPLGAFAVAVCTVPCSSADIARVFSMARYRTLYKQCKLKPVTLCDRRMLLHNKQFRE